MKNKKYLFKSIIIIILLLFASTFLMAHDNPFAPKVDKQKKIKHVEYPSFLQKIFTKIASYQHKLNNKLAQLSDKLKVVDALRSGRMKKKMKKRMRR